MVAILDFLENSKIAQINKKLIKNIENVTNLLKVIIWIVKLEMKMYFRQIYVKIIKTAFVKVVAMAMA